MISQNEKFQLLPAETSPDKSEFSPLWTVMDVAYYLSLNPETVRVMVRRGELPAKKVGRQFRFQQEEMIQWVGNQNVQEKKYKTDIAEGEGTL